jgi:hypothetical protein
VSPALISQIPQAPQTHKIGSTAEIQLPSGVQALVVAVLLQSAAEIQRVADGLTQEVTVKKPTEPVNLAD